MRINIENFVTPWSKLSGREFDSWHSMCSYLGAFPPTLANYFIRYFTEQNDLVFDPFSGRGTTSLEAKLLNRRSVATDLNPIAIRLTEAKNVSLDKQSIFDRIGDLEKRYDPALYQPEALAQHEDIHLIFHPRTLAQLCFLKRKLLKSELQVDKYLIGISLGILHGGERADGTSGYASIDMPNTFSMSPDYVRRFVQTKRLNRAFRNVFDLLREKTDRLYKKHNNFDSVGFVSEADAKELSTNEALKQFQKKVDLIITSPPYLGIVNYAKQNWIRLWFLDQKPNEISDNLDDDLNLDEWVAFAKKFVNQLKSFLKPEGIAVFVIGDVAKSKNSIVPLAREFCLLVKEEKLFKNIWCINDTVEEFNKTTRIWGDTKGTATAVDRIVILSDIDPFTKNNFKTDIETLNIDFVLESTKAFIGSS
ncbi:MAG TPA: DNA methyltransferase [Flavisolibacter sp.]|nr:DNA methyltransferase [Flavisolibacter sp.]